MSTSQPLILIVGAADTGRAPMAVALLRRLLRQRGRSWAVESAGVVGHDGDPAEPEARDAMFTLGLDISGHLARSLDDALVESAALLLAVDRGVARVLRGRPQPARVVALGELAPGSRDIPDPFRMQIGAWLIYAREIEATLRAGLPRLVALVGGEDQEQGQQGDSAGGEPPDLPASEPAVVTIHPARAAALERAERLLGLLADAPAVIDWSAAREQLSADLSEAAARPLTPGDLAEPYAAVIKAMLGLNASAPRSSQISALRAAISRMRGPLAAADISALSAVLPAYAAE
jgi:protein-tyrosine-phosphatase